MKSNQSRGQCGLVGWGVMPWTEKLKVLFLVGAHTKVSNLIPGQARVRRQPINVSLSPSLKSNESAEGGGYTGTSGNVKEYNKDYIFKIIIK